jgi:hypothetical protein
MTDSKKPTRAPSTTSGVFEPHRPSLGPGPGLRLPPPDASVPEMAPLKVPVESKSPGDSPEGAPLGAPPATVSALGAAPVNAPEIVIKNAPEPAEQPPLPPSLPPSSLRPPGTAGARGRRLLLVVLAASLLVVGLLVGRLRHGGRTRAAFTGSGHVGVFSATFEVRTFQRGNIHTHTTRSDGAQSPREVATWYRDHGYQFLAITDHDVLVDPVELGDLETPGFVLIPGEEITSLGNEKPVHLLALCIDHLIVSGRFDAPLEALVQGTAAVRAQNGFVVVNHPNFSWALGLADVTPLSGSYGLEIWSGHPASHSSGDATRPSHQALWEELLTRDRRVTAVAVDDEHTLVASGKGGDALPGRAWIETFGETGRAAICESLRSGRFYASSGVAFRRIRVEPRRFTVWVDHPLDAVEFVASAGQTLANVAGRALAADADGFAASYSLRGGETYVRVVVKGPDGTGAWTQAYYTNP